MITSTYKCMHSRTAQGLRLLPVSRYPAHDGRLRTLLFCSQVRRNGEGGLDCYIHPIPYPTCRPGEGHLATRCRCGLNLFRRQFILSGLEGRLLHTSHIRFYAGISCTGYYYYHVASAQDVTYDYIPMIGSMYTCIHTSIPQRAQRLFSGFARRDPCSPAPLFPFPWRLPPKTLARPSCVLLKIRWL